MERSTVALAWVAGSLGHRLPAPPDPARRSARPASPDAPPARAQAGRRRGAAVALGGLHLHQLPASGQQRRHVLAGGIGLGPRLRLHPLPEEGQHLRIQGIGLGQLAGGAGEVAHLQRVDDRHRQPGRLQRRHGRRLIAPRRLQHHQLGRAGSCRRADQGGDAGRVVGKALDRALARPATSSQSLATSIPIHPLSGSSLRSFRFRRRPHSAPPCLIRAWQPRQPFGLWRGDRRTAPCSPTISTRSKGSRARPSGATRSIPTGPIRRRHHTTTTCFEHTKGRG